MTNSLALSTRYSPPVLDHTCSNSDAKSTASDLTGPGRALGKLYSCWGKHLELLLDKVVMRTGRAPSVIAKRIIRHHEATLLITSAHDISSRCLEYPSLPGCGPNDVKHVIRSAVALQKIGKKIKKDSRRLVDLTSSSSPSTQLQAAESIHRLSTWSDELRAILEASGARPALSKLIWLNKVFRFKNREVGCALLSSCEKALASVEDTAFHSVLKEWKCVTGCGWLPEDVARPIWVKISTYLSSSDHAFVALRTLRGSSTNVLGEHLPILTLFVLRTIRDSPGYFEWPECEEVICLCFSWGYENLVLSWLEMISDWLLQNVQNMPGILEEPRVKVLGNDVFRMEPAGFVLHHRLLFAIVKGIRSVVSQDLSAELLRSRYTCTGLLPFLSLFACPLATAVGKFVSKHQFFYRETPGSEERTLYGILVSFINSPNTTTRARAWAYIDYFQEHDIHRCNTLLDVLRSASATSEIISAFLDMTKNCLPEKANDHDYVRYYRYPECQSAVHYRIYQEADMSWRNPTRMQVMEFPWHWTLKTEVKQGEPISQGVYQPLVVGFDRPGNPIHLVDIPITSIQGGVGRSSTRVLTAVKEGTKPEDLRVKIFSGDQTACVVPEKFEVPVLRYALESYAKILRIEKEELFRSGPFSWKPVDEAEEDEEVGVEDGDEDGDEDEDEDEDEDKDKDEDNEWSLYSSDIDESSSEKIIAIEEVMHNGHSQDWVTNADEQHDDPPSGGDNAGPQQPESEEYLDSIRHADGEAISALIQGTTVLSGDQDTESASDAPQGNTYELRRDLRVDRACSGLATPSREDAEIPQASGGMGRLAWALPKILSQDRCKKCSDGLQLPVTDEKEAPKTTHLAPVSVSRMSFLSSTIAFAFGLFLGNGNYLC